MNDSLPTQARIPPRLLVPAGQDQYGETRTMGITTLTFKVSSPDPNSLFVIEQTFHKKGGPPRHLHFHQDEWFYALEGEFIIEIDQQQYKLSAGDSLLAPRKIPHVWAFVGNHKGRMLITFMPAGKMVAFFRETTKADAMPPQTPELWRSHDMELLGPPLAVG